MPHVLSCMLRLINGYRPSPTLLLTLTALLGMSAPVQAHTSFLRCHMLGTDMQPHAFADVFEIDAEQDRIVRVDGQYAAAGGWSQRVSAAAYHLTKPGPGRQRAGGDGLPYWEWRIDRATGKATHSVWLAVHNTRSHWAGECTTLYQTQPIGP